VNGTLSPDIDPNPITWVSRNDVSNATPQTTGVLQTKAATDGNSTYWKGCASASSSKVFWRCSNLYCCRDAPFTGSLDHKPHHHRIRPLRSRYDVLLHLSRPDTTFHPHPNAVRPICDSLCSLAVVPYGIPRWCTLPFRREPQTDSGTGGDVIHFTVQFSTDARGYDLIPGNILSTGCS